MSYWPTSSRWLAACIVVFLGTMGLWRRWYSWREVSAGVQFQWKLWRRNRALWHLRHKIVGYPKKAILHHFGPPRTALMPARRALNGPPFLQTADLWYYPLPRQHAALAVRFERDIARSVEWIITPA